MRSFAKTVLFQIYIVSGLDQLSAITFKEISSVAMLPLLRN